MSEAGSEQSALICTSCQQPVTKLGQASFPVAKQCQYCFSSDLGWRDAASKTWKAQALNADEGEDGPWVRGDFDGDYQGNLNGSDFRKLGGERGLGHEYGLKFTRAQLDNVELIDAPPDMRLDNEKHPVRIRKVNDVFVYRPDEGGAKIFKADLLDFRMHDWQQTSGEDDGSGKISGRLQGLAYARLWLPPKPDPKKQSSPKPSAPQTPNPAAQPGATAQQPVSPQEQPVPPPAVKQDYDNNAYCNTCNLFVLAAVFICLYVSCKLSTALLGVAVMALQCWWRSNRMRNGKNDWSNGVEIAVGVVLCVLAGLVYLGVRYENCINASLWWLAGLAMLLVLTAVTRRCWPWLVISVIWVLLILSFYCRSLYGDCALPPAQAEDSPISMPSLNPLPSLSHAFDNLRGGVEQMLAFDQDSQVVSSQSLDTNGGRVSIDQALQNPQQFFSCDSEAGAGQSSDAAKKYNIYFGEAALFQKDKAVLGAGADAHLKKIARLIASNPNVKIILTGHADHSGQQDHNFFLSQQCAQVVADWLMQNKVLPRERIEVRAAGDRYPVVNDPSLFRLNRRVEMSIDCTRKASQ